ncbi:hypothetical protein [Fimbriiglobus ruber]|uniref:Uncharacterized protein n=1 Tax=Fimbriiglobus ruber TaxID=1908690 RepID=A0A225E1B2_9BACT|nr:hypothetical protein [Fimbriiglobus ruber]OWK43806.1 hypothetical protein FRUB_03405 [Fimbriiglobus ruber]
MIDFRCWYCNKRYFKQEAQIRSRFRCSCEHILKVPRQSGGYCRVRRPIDWLVEIVVYGGGGALLGFFLAIFIGSRLPFFRRSIYLIGGLTLAGFLFGALGGERGINLIGRMIREREQG